MADLPGLFFFRDKASALVINFKAATFHAQNRSMASIRSCKLFSMADLSLSYFISIFIQEVYIAVKFRSF